MQGSCRSWRQGWGLGEGWLKRIIVVKAKLQQGVKVRNGVCAKQLQFMGLRVRGGGRDG